MNKLLALSVVSLLSGCAVFTGTDANSDFACAAPEGYSSTSMTGVYANINNPDLPKGTKTTFLGASQNHAYAVRHKAGMDEHGRLPITHYQDSGAPIRTQPQIMRIWVAPWESSDKTFYDQNFVYSVIDQGDWVLTHNKSNIISAYAPNTLGVGVAQGNVTSIDAHKQQKTQDEKQSVSEEVELQLTDEVNQGSQ